MIRNITNVCMIRKYAAILTFAVSAVFFLPEELFAQGAVVGYANPIGLTGIALNNYPSDDQLESLTHVITVDIGCNTDGTLKNGINLPNSWNGNKNQWLINLVSRAHQKGVKVSICISGGTEFIGATSQA